MKQSTAKFISYDLRPAKQTERRILLDFLKCANEGGITISDCRYVGMGGTKFYDFHMMHRFLGIGEMVSLERDAKTYPRCEFNRPFHFIKTTNKSAATFLTEDTHKTPTIYWFDYDDGFGPDIIADIISLGTRVTVGGFAFITVCGALPAFLEKATAEKRLEWFQQNMGDFSSGLTLEDMAPSEFSNSVYKVLIASLKHAFSARSDGVFETLFRIQYSDSTLMITVGGYFVDKLRAANIKARIKTDLPFLLNGAPYTIANLNLTTRERELFDVAITKGRSNSKELNSLRSLGFKDKDFDAYRDLLRFIPRYHESLI